VRLADGTTNWEGLGGDDVDEPDSLPQGRDGGEFRLERVAGLRVTDAAIRFEDRQAGSVTEVAIPTLSTGELAPGVAFPVEAEASVALDDGETQLAAKLAGAVNYMDEGPSFEIEGLNLDFEGTGPGVPGGAQRGTLTAP